MGRGTLRLVICSVVGSLAGCGSGSGGSPDGATPDAAADAAALVDAGPDAADATVDAPMVELPRPAPGPGFHVRGRQIVDAQGRVVVLHGVNVSNDAKRSADYMPWHGPEDFVDLAEAGFDAVRLLMTWAAIMPERGMIDTVYLDDLAERIDWAHDAGLIVILDMHQDLFGEGFGGDGAPRWACDASYYETYEPISPWWRNYTAPEVRACFQQLYEDDVLFGLFVDAWKAAAERFGDHPAVLGFDLLNEPHFGDKTPEASVIEDQQPRFRQLAMELLSIAPDRVVFYESPPLASLFVEAPFEEAYDERIAYAPHYYHPELHEGGDYDPSQDISILRSLDAIEHGADNLGGVPVWLGEYGAFTDNPTTPAFLRMFLPELSRRQWSWAWWSDDPGDGGFDLRDPDGVLRPEIVALLGHPYVRRAPGWILARELDLEAREMTVRFVWELDAPLEVWAGAGGMLTVAPADGTEEPVRCDPAADAAPGVMTCPVPDGGAFGRRYNAYIRW